MARPTPPSAGLRFQPKPVGGVFFFAALAKVSLLTGVSFADGVDNPQVISVNSLDNVKFVK
jgi:hypothetical protein